MQNIMWKPPVIDHVVPMNSRAATNIEYSSLLSHSFGKQNPIKHWRKQLQPQFPSQSTQISLDAYNAPGGTSKTFNCSTEPSSLLMKTYIHQGTTCNVSNQCDGRQKIKTATTNLSKTYYTTSGQYLKSKARTYKQHLNDSHNADPCETNKNHAVYDKNNSNYSQQGAVSSGSRVDRLKLDTINKNAASLKAVYGSQSASAASYKGTRETPRCTKTINYVENTKFYHKKCCS